MSRFLAKSEERKANSEERMAKSENRNSGMMSAWTT